jgi:hypothetical protein
MSSSPSSGHCRPVDPRDAARSGSNGTLIDCNGRHTPLSSNVGGPAPAAACWISAVFPTPASPKTRSVSD